MADVLRMLVDSYKSIHQSNGVLTNGMRSLSDVNYSHLFFQYRLMQMNETSMLKCMNPGVCKCDAYELEQCRGIPTRGSKRVVDFLYEGSVCPVTMYMVIKYLRDETTMQMVLLEEVYFHMKRELFVVFMKVAQSMKDVNTGEEDVDLICETDVNKFGELFFGELDKIEGDKRKCIS